MKTRSIAKKTFVTLFLSTSNVHLLKDVGMIPFCMYRDYGYDSTLVCFRNGEEYPSLEDEVKGLKIRFLEQEKGYAFGKFSKKALAYLRKNARKIDVLNLYHNTKETLLYAFVYKLFNPAGIVYIKLDIEINAFDAQKTQKVHKFRMWGYRWFFKHIAAIVSCELPSAEAYLRASIPSLKDKLVLLPNGIDDIFIRDKKISLLPFGKKENLLITVGRIGAPEKNNEMLLHAVERIALGSWKVVFIGPVTAGFRAEYARVIARHPHLKEQIILTGNVTGKEELYGWYNRAKVFCLTSDYEGFPLVFTEALYFGNYIVTTDVAPASYITDSQRLGRIVKTEEELVCVLQDIINGTLDIPAFYDAILHYSQKFRWKSNLKIIDERIRALTCRK